MISEIYPLFNTPHDPLMLLLIGCSEGYMVIHAFHSLMHRNDRSPKMYALAMVIYVIATILDAYFNLEVYYVMIICYLLITIISLLFYDDPLEIRLLIPFVFVALNYSATILSVISVWLLNSADVEKYPQNLRMDYLSQCVLFVFFFLLLSLFYLLKKLDNKATTKSIMVYFVCCPLFLMLCVINLLYTTNADENISQFIHYQLLIAGTLLLISAILFSMANRAAKLHRAIMHSASLEQLISVQEQYYLSLQDHQNRLRHLSHDIKNHNRAINGLISHGKYQEAMDYSNTLVKDAELLTPDTDCRNVVIGALLDNRFGSIKAEGVKISLCVMVPQVLSIKDSDLCIILGNLFDNAVEACRNDPDTENRFIDVDIRLKGPLLCINIKNSFSGAVNYSNGTYFTIKPEAHSHGIGLSNVREVVKKYNGRTIIKHSGQIFSVTVLLFYPVQNTDETQTPSV